MRRPIGLSALLIGAAASPAWAETQPSIRPFKQASPVFEAGVERGERSPYLVYNAAAFSPGLLDTIDVLDYVLAPLNGLPNVRVSRETLPGQSYAVWITGPSRTLGVDNGSRWVTCRLLTDIHRGSQTYTTGPMAVIVVRFTAMTCRDSPGVSGTKCPKDYSIFDSGEVEKMHVASLLDSLAKRVTTGRPGRAMERPPSSFQL